MAPEEHPGHDPGQDETVSEAPAGLPSNAPDVVIGPYHLLRIIGEGGMGEVWLAEQTQPVRRRVAIKLIKAGMDTREVVARFESERQALALMDHPAIAKVFDAGATPEGRPYFAMEYVDGIPITTYCDRHRLTMRARLQLFIEVCEGVQHAHQKAIIHRDLKPSNILVTEVNGKPMPRIIDFGVAKAVSQGLNAETMFTRVGMVLGTPGYMSPEQADSAGQDIDTRSDVYSLGAILYELLVGQLPLDFRKLAFDEVLRRLREQDAPRPSTRLRSLGADSAITAQNRSADLPLLVRQLRGDADVITLKALEKDRTRRYASPSDLAADIGRLLRNEPVNAHAPGAMYRAGKYIRRHTLGVALAALAVLLLIGFAIAQSVALRRVTRERDRADRITEFMTGIFRVPNPSIARGNTVTARELLDKGATQVNAGLGNDPELQAKMIYTMANTYYGLGLYPKTQSLLEQALQIQQRVLGPRHRDTLRSESYLAAVQADLGHPAQAEKLARDTLDTDRKVLGSTDADTLVASFRLATILRMDGHTAEAEKLYRELLPNEQRVFGPEDSRTLRTMGNLGGALVDEGRLPEAEKMARDTLAIQRRVLGPDHPNTLHTMALLSVIVLNEGHLAEAEQLYRDTFAACTRVLGPENPVTLNAMGGLANVLTQEGHDKEAEALQRKTIEIQRRVLGPEDPETLISQGLLAQTLDDEERSREAEQLFRETAATESRVLGPDNQRTLRSVCGIGNSLSHEGRYPEAEKVFRQAIAEAQKANQPGVLASIWYNFAGAAAFAGHKEDAILYLGKAIDLGLTGPDWITADTDLESLHPDPRFKALVEKAREAAKHP
jgi:serine/threonine protein kinase